MTRMTAPVDIIPMTDANEVLELYGPWFPMGHRSGPDDDLIRNMENLAWRSGWLVADLENIRVLLADALKVVPKRHDYIRDRLEEKIVKLNRTIRLIAEADARSDARIAKYKDASTTQSSG